MRRSRTTATLCRKDFVHSFEADSGRPVDPSNVTRSNAESVTFSWVRNSVQRPACRLARINPEVKPCTQTTNANSPSAAAISLATTGATLALAACGDMPEQQQQAQKRPNILFLLPDQMRGQAWAAWDTRMSKPQLGQTSFRGTSVPQHLRQHARLLSRQSKHPDRKILALERHDRQRPAAARVRDLHRRDPC